MIDEKEALLKECLELLHKLKSNHGLWTGRHGLNPNEREDINDLLKQECKTCGS